MFCIAGRLKQALAIYTESVGKCDPTFDTKQAIAVMLEKHHVACDMMHGHDWSKWTTGTLIERLQLIPSARKHILKQGDGKKHWFG